MNIRAALSLPNSLDLVVEQSPASLHTANFSAAVI
jgi:hypothetical protein